MKVLLIEDDPTVLRPIKKLLDDNGHTSQVIDFEQFKNGAYNISPEIIVFDLMDGNPDVDSEGKGGKSVFETIWNRHFCPVVAYSSNTDLLDTYLTEENRDHPFIVKIKKGSGSETLLFEKLIDFDNCITQINTIKDDISTILLSTLRDSAKYMLGTDKDSPLSTDVLLRLGRRRIAASLDGGSFIGKKLAPWEMYILPPLTDYPKMGDIICKKPFDKSNSNSYFVVLTPSCDLIPRENLGGKPKVSNVLCVKCNEMEIKDKFTKGYRQGFNNEIGIVPGIPKHMPTMTFDLKNNLSVIDYSQIGNSDDGNVEYLRVASLDSPFREHLAWHFSQVACRPGTPDIDWIAWQENTIDEARKKNEEDSESS